jgi:predicted RND superfamily exporter protein
VLGVLVTLIVAPGALRLELRTDGHALVPPDAPEVRFDLAVRDEFGIEDPYVIMIRTDHPHGIFNIKTLELVRDLTDAVRRLDGINEASLFSLATEHTFRVKPNSLDYRTFLEWMPDTPQKMYQLRNDLRRIALYDGTLISDDKQGTVILVGAPPEADRVALYREIKTLVQPHNDAQHRIHVIGPPVAEALLGTHILEDLGVPDALLGARIERGQSTGAGGTPGTLYQVRRFVAEHLGLVPVAIAIMAAVFLIVFRSVVATLLPLMEVGACLAFVFGLMGWCGVPIYLTIAVLPVILTAMGVADEIHLFHRYKKLLRKHGAEDYVGVLTQTMDEMAQPIVKTSVTTAVGFLSFGLSPLGPVKAFGIFTAVGILFCMLWSLTVIPALLALIPPGRTVRLRKVETDAEPTPGFAVPRLAMRGVMRFRFVLAAAGLAVVVLAVDGVRRVVVQDSWIEGFDPQSDFRRATREFNEQYFGTHILLACLDGCRDSITGELTSEQLGAHAITIPGDRVDDTASLTRSWITLTIPDRRNQPGRRRLTNEWSSWIERAERYGDQVVIHLPQRAGTPGFTLRPLPTDRIEYSIDAAPFLDPQTLKTAGRFEDWIRAYPSDMIGGAHGPAEYVATSHFMAYPNAEGSRRIPDTPKRVRWLWRQYKRVRGPERLRQVVDEDYERALVTVFMKDANFVDVGSFLSDVRDYEQAHLVPNGIKVNFAGDVAVSQTLIQAIVTTQVRSLLLSLVGIVVVTAILARSLAWGFFCVLPSAFAVLVNFAVMGWSGTPLGVATSMFAGMTLGIGVDFAIHFIERLRLMCSRGFSREAALIDAGVQVGPAILIDALAVALGFGVMVISRVPANARLGALVVLSLINCVIATLILLPALLCIWAPRPARAPSTLAIETA